MTDQPGQPDPDAGSAALLRLAAIPLATFLCGGNPEIFTRLRFLDEQTTGYADRARAVAEEIGTSLVPHPALDARSRAGALRVRRALHSGSVPPPAQTDSVARIAARLLPQARLDARLRDLLASDAALRALRTDLERLIAAEDERLLADAWWLLHATPFGRRAAAEGDLAVYRDIAGRVAAGEPWTSKRMRRRADYLWRILARASTRATPRGWLGHVALVPVRADGRWDGTRPLRVGRRTATEYSANLELHRNALTAAASRELPETVALALAPLWTLGPEHLVVWTLEADRPNTLGEVRLRRTAVLDSIVEHLAAGPLPAGRLLDLCARSGVDDRAALVGLLTHLVGLSVLQAGAEVPRALAGWTPVRPTARGVGPKGWGAGKSRITPVEPRNDYVDVYRPALDAMSVPYARRLTSLVRLAMRVMNAIDLDGPPDVLPVPDAITERPRPLLDIARDCLTHDVEVGPGWPHHHDWPPPRRPGSTYSRLLAWLADHKDGAPSVDLDPATLDAIGAPEPALPWPVDALLVPIREPGLDAVLEHVTPAGVLDSRFAGALGQLHTELPQVRAHRAFLAGLQAESGIPFMEVLIPPLNVRAANAVRRPTFAALWTGDPDRGGYLDSGPASYVPLSRITLRRSGARVMGGGPEGPGGGQIIAEVGGDPVWPVQHTAKLPSPPWGTIVGLLMLASPQPDRSRWRPLRYSLPAWPDHTFVPRITVGGGLVVTPAQWRVPTAALWRPGDRLVDKFARLERLSRQLGLPRLVHAVADLHEQPMAVDLVSPHGIRVLDRMIQRATGPVTLRETLVDPDRLAARDEATGGGSLTELVLRLPADQPHSGQPGAGASARRHKAHGDHAESTVRQPAAVR